MRRYKLGKKKKMTQDEMEQGVEWKKLEEETKTKVSKIEQERGCNNYYMKRDANEWGEWRV